MFYKILTVVVLSSFEIYAAIPTGYAMGLTMPIVLVASIAGGFLGVFVFSFLGEKIRSIIIKKLRLHHKIHHKDSMAHRLWKKFGVVGLGFFGTLVLGAPISIAVGISLNASLHTLVKWCCAGVVVRCAILATIGHFGVKLF